MAQYTSDTISIDRVKIEMFLGPLEASVMRALWAGAKTSKRIYQYVRDNYTTDATDEIMYTSVSSTLHRLWQRGFATRTGGRGSYQYSAKIASEAEFVTICVSRVVWSLLRQYPDEFKQVLRTIAQGPIDDTIGGNE